MTELTGSEEAAQPSPDWPRLDTAAISDPAVAQALSRLSALPQAPVAEHEAAYGQLHDELLEALDAEPADNATPEGGA